MPSQDYVNSGLTPATRVMTESSKPLLLLVSWKPAVAGRSNASKLTSRGSSARQ